MLDDEISSFADMLDKNLDITYHQWNIQVLMIELFKTMNNLALPIINSMVTNLQEFPAETQICQMWPGN